MTRWQRLAAGGAGALVIASALAASYEGLRTHAYNDVGGVATICYGHTGSTAQEATPAQCEAWLTVDMQRAVQGVSRCLVRKPTPWQLASFADLAYNIGVPRFCRSSVARNFNHGNTIAACNAISLYKYAGGAVQPGLVRRREAERSLCLSGH